MSSPNPVLDILERSLTHARAESGYDAQLEELNKMNSGLLGWSGAGNFDVDFKRIPNKYRQQLTSGEIIGSQGAFAVVKRIVYRGIPLAQKTIMPNSQRDVDLIKQETLIGKRVDGHKHIVKLVGTYQSTSLGNNFHHILTFPVAACDLEQFLNDFEILRKPSEAYTLGRQCEIAIRLLALGFSSSMAPSEIPTAVMGRLIEIIGCVTTAIKWIHSQDVQHRDLKPHNILLRPGQVYITDFGISRAARNGTTQSYAGHSTGYSAPEVLAQDEINPEQADVYSLGCIFLHIITLHNGHYDRRDCSNILCSNPRERQERIAIYVEKDLCLPTEADARTRPSYEVKPLSAEFILSLIADDRTRRPSVEDIDSWLWFNGGTAQIYYGNCCRRHDFEV